MIDFVHSALQNLFFKPIISICCTRFISTACIIASLHLSLFVCVSIYILFTVWLVICNKKSVCMRTFYKLMKSFEKALISKGRRNPPPIERWDEKDYDLLEQPTSTWHCRQRSCQRGKSSKNTFHLITIQRFNRQFSFYIFCFRYWSGKKKI